MFEYIRNNEISRVVFDPFEPKFDDSAFALGKMDWKELYGDAEDEISTGMLEALVKSAHTMCFVDANNADHIVIRHLYTGVLIYVINLPII